MEEALVLHILHKVILYICKVHLSDITSQYLDTVIGKKSYQLQHSLESESKVKEMMSKNVDYPCGICGKECIEIMNKKHAIFDDFSVECDTCSKWFHYVCANLSGKEPELQKGSDLPFYCPNCKPVDEVSMDEPSLSNVKPKKGRGKKNIKSSLPSQVSTSTSSSGIDVSHQLQQDLTSTDKPATTTRGRQIRKPKRFDD